MKHLCKIIIAVVFLIPVFLGNQHTKAAVAVPINVTINGQALYFDQPPIMEKGRVLIPMRTIFEVVGANVEWSQKTKTVKVTKGTTNIILPLNSKQATINGTKKSLDVPAKSVNGRTLVPLRFVSEALGCKVEWKSAQSLVVITFDGDVKEQTGKVYPDGWVAPLLKSAWSPNQAQNYDVLQNELGFKDGGRVYAIKGHTQVIQVISQGDSGSYEVGIKFMGWTDPGLEESYRIPIVAKELFKLYFGSDATRVWNYFNSNDIPEKFSANGRSVKASYIEVEGAVYLEVGRK